MGRLTSMNPLTESEAMNLSLTDLYMRLKAYEDAEEQGRLVVLPCKVGDMVYEIVPKCKPGWNECPYDGGYGIERCEDRKCAAYIQEGTFGFEDLYNIGKTVFLTREKAEKALEEMNNG